MTEPTAPRSGAPAARDRIHVDADGRVLTDSDLALLARGLGRVVTWPPLREAPPPQAVHLAHLRTTQFGGRPGGDMPAAIRAYDARRRAAGKAEVFGGQFLLAAAISEAKDRRRARPAGPSGAGDADVLRMWLDA